MVNMVPHEAFACRCAEGDVVLRQSYKPESYGKLYYACPKSKPPKHFGCGFFLWKETRLRELMSSPGAPSYSAGHSTPPSYSSGPSTPPSYSSGPSTPTKYSLGSSRNRVCSNCKHLCGKISVLKATMEMHMHPKQYTVNSVALFQEVLNEMEKLDLERDYLVDFEEYDGGNILLGDGRECRVRGTGKVQVQMRDGSSFVLDNVMYVPKLRRNLISLGTLEKEGFTVKMQSGKIKAVTKKILKGRKQLEKYQTGWKIKTVIQHQNGLVKEKNVTLLAKVVLYRNIGFNESEKYKKTFIGSGVGTGSVQVLQGVEFEVEPQEDHAFEVEPLRNVGQGAGPHKVQTQDLIYYHSVRDREQHSACVGQGAEDSNEAAFAVAEAKNIYAHELLTFNNTVACEVISKWKAGLKDDMDARSDVYVLSNGCTKCSDDSDDYYWEYTPGLLDEAKGDILGIEIIRDQL
ncbi:hypothetical protein Tco_0852712 [Tanacetum coccineum]